jgi:hypothetical protein
MSFCLTQSGIQPKQCLRQKTNAVQRDFSSGTRASREKPVIL